MPNLTEVKYPYLAYNPQHRAWKASTESWQWIGFWSVEPSPLRPILSLSLLESGCGRVNIFSKNNDSRVKRLRWIWRFVLIRFQEITEFVSLLHLEQVTPNLENATSVFKVVFWISCSHCGWYRWSRASSLSVSTGIYLDWLVNTCLVCYI